MDRKKILVIGARYEGCEMDFKRYELYDFSIEQILEMVDLIATLEGMEG
jgi:hypothetical protein